MARIESLPDPNQATEVGRPNIPFQSLGSNAVNGYERSVSSQEEKLLDGPVIADWRANLTEAGFSIPDLTYAQQPEFTKTAHHLVYSHYHDIFTTARSKGRKERPVIPLLLAHKRITRFYEDHLDAKIKKDNHGLHKLSEVKKDNVKRALNYQEFFPEIKATKLFADRLEATGSIIGADAMQDLLTVYGISVREIVRALEQQKTLH